MFNETQVIKRKPATLNLATGRILAFFLAIFLIIIRLTQPTSASQDLLGTIISSSTIIYSLGVFIFSFFNNFVKKQIYWFILIAFVIYASGFYYILYKNNFSELTTSGLFVFSILTAYFMLTVEHLLIYQIFLITLALLTYFVSPTQTDSSLNFLIRFSTLHIIVFIIFASRVRFIQNLIKSNYEKEEMISKLNCGVFQIDRFGQFTLANNMFCSMTEYSQREVFKNLNFQDVVLKDDWSQLQNIIDKSHAGESDKFEARLIRKEGTPFWVFGTATPRFGENNSVIGSTFIMADITQKKALTDEYEERIQDQELTIKGLTQKNEELQRFAHWAALELRIVHESMIQPINSLKEYDNPVNGFDKKITQLIQSSKKLDDLIDRLQFYSLTSFVKPHYEKVNSEEIVSEIIESLKEEISLNKAELSFSDLPEVEVDRSQFHRLLHNLIENGLKYRGSDTPRITVSCTEDLEKEEFVFAVEDNGVGINKSDYNKIFRLFEQEEEKDQGTLGLGLAICKKIAINHRGRLWFTSNYGKGSTFFVSIPVNKEEAKEGKNNSTPVI